MNGLKTFPCKYQPRYSPDCSPDIFYTNKLGEFPGASKLFSFNGGVFDKVTTLGGQI